LRRNHSCSARRNDCFESFTGGSAGISSLAACNRALKIP
jgi:hypothetical protein